jgi:hypothetical protein
MTSLGFLDGTTVALQAGMDATVLQELYRIGAAAGDVGVLEWLWHFLASGAITALAFLMSGVGRRLLVALALLPLFLGVARAQEPTRSDDEVTARLHFLEQRLKAETAQARAWQYGWAVVDMGGVGYSVYQISQSSSNSQLAEGVVGAVKSFGGVVGLALTPFHATRGAHELDGLPDGTPEERERRMRLAEQLVRRNAHETEIRYQWKPHFYNALVNLAAGGIIMAFGDWQRGLQSAGIGIAVGEVQIWTQPWQAKRDLREYSMQFGAMASTETPAPAVARVTVKAGATGLQVTF